MKKIPFLWLCLFSLLLGSQVYILADDTGYVVAGEILFKKNHAIIVEVINKEEYDKNLTSQFRQVIQIDEELYEKKKANFTIPNVPLGDYIVKVYQDLNGNGKFDFALIGGEPLGTYKKPGFTLGRPSFKSLAFALTKDLTGIKINL